MPASKPASTSAWMANSGDPPGRRWTLLAGLRDHVLGGRSDEGERGHPGRIRRAGSVDRSPCASPGSTTLRGAAEPGRLPAFLRGGALRLLAVCVVVWAIGMLPVRLSPTGAGQLVLAGVVITLCAAVAFAAGTRRMLRSSTSRS